MVVEWPFQNNGSKRNDTALIKVDLCNLKGVLKSCIGPNGLWAVGMWYNIHTYIQTHNSQIK